MASDSSEEEERGKIRIESKQTLSSSLHLLLNHRILEWFGVGGILNMRS